MSNDEQQPCKRGNNQVKCYMLYDNERVLEKELIVRPRTAKLTLYLIKLMKYGIVQFFRNEYLEKSPNLEYIPNVHR